MEALYEQTRKFETSHSNPSHAKLSQDLLEITDLAGGWETLGMGGIWQPRQEVQECKDELAQVKEELAQERMLRSKTAEEHRKLQEKLKTEIVAKAKLDETIQMLKEESQATALKEKSSWEKQMKVSNYLTDIERNINIDWSGITN